MSPVGNPISHIIHHPKYGCNSADSELVAKYPPIVPMPPRSTRHQPRCLVGTISASSALAAGSMPPAASPIMKHMKTFQEKDGMAPQMDVPTNMTAASRIEARRP